MQKGKIIKGIGGFYYVHTRDNVIYECRAKGIFRKNGIKPLVGDDVGRSWMRKRRQEISWRSFPGKIP